MRPSLFYIRRCETKWDGITIPLPKPPRGLAPAARKKASGLMMFLLRKQKEDAMNIINENSGTEISHSAALRILKALEGYARCATNAKKRRHDGRYDTPAEAGVKWQMDVKYVPAECKAPGLEGRFYQYTILDGASRKRFLHFGDEHSMYEAERSHRVDQEKFYRTLSFYSLEDLRKRGKGWNSRYNNMPRTILKLKTPNQAELESLKRIMDNTGEVRCPKLLKCFTSTDN